MSLFPGTDQSLEDLGLAWLGLRSRGGSRWFLYPRDPPEWRMLSKSSVYINLGVLDFLRWPLASLQRFFSSALELEGVSCSGDHRGRGLVVGGMSELTSVLCLELPRPFPAAAP